MMKNCDFLPNFTMFYILFTSSVTKTIVEIEHKKSG